MTEIKIRELKARDVRVLAKMLAKMDTESISKVQHLIQSQQSKRTQVALFEVGFSIVQTIASVTDDIWSWLADLAGVSAGELDEMDFSAPKQIVMQLIQGGQFQDFFGSAINLAGSRGDSTTSSKADTDGATKK